MSVKLLTQLGENLHLLTPPGVAMQVLEKASDPDCTMEAVSKLISHDPALCAKLLKTVNSALFNPTSTVVSVERAVNVLGLRAVRALVISLSLPALGRRTGADQVTRDFWKQAVTGAIVARELAEKLGSPTPEEDMVAGLLRDLGMVVFYQFYPDEYRQLLASGRETLAQRQCELEEAHFGVHHAAVTAQLLKSWRLPDEITEPIAYHHHPTVAEGCPQRFLTRTAILHFGETIANLEAASYCPLLLRGVLKLAQTRFNMNLIQLGEFLDPLAGKIREFAGLLDVNIGYCENLGAILERAVAETDRLRSAADAVHVSCPQVSVAELQQSIQQANADSLHDALPGAAGPCAELQAHARYRMVEQLGAGGAGVVWKAEHLLMGRPVAIKVINRALTTDAATVTQFQQEIRAAARLAHPNIVTAYDAEQAGDVHFLVMEYIDGVSLDRLVARHGPLPIADACHFVREAALGLQHAYEQGMVHRDIKPQNLMVARDGRLKLLDFGLACLAGSGRPEDAATTPVVGTPDYIAPEQARNSGAVDIRADLYGLGCTLYYLLTGKPPFGGTSSVEKLILHWEADAEPVIQRRSEVPPAVANLVRRLMAKRPDDRCQTPAELAEALAPWAKLTIPVDELCEPEAAPPPILPAASETTPAAAPPAVCLQGTEIILPSELPPSRENVSWWGLAGAAVAFLVSGVLCYWLIQGKDATKRTAHDPVRNTETVSTQ